MSIGAILRSMRTAFVGLCGMPAEDNGLYLVEVASASPWYRWVRFSLEVKGIRKAYILARWEAIKLDCFGGISYCCAITWRVTRITPKGGNLNLS